MDFLKKLKSLFKTSEEQNIEQERIEKNIKKKRTNQKRQKKRKNDNNSNLINEELKEILKYQNFLEDFNENLEQKRAVISNFNRILVLAGAGSGKTKVLTKRFVHLVKNKKIPKNRILALTFTKEAANEMRERISKELELEEDSLKYNIRTFHSLALSILKQNDRGFKLIDDKTQRSILKQILYQFKDEEDIMNSIISYITIYKVPEVEKKDIVERDEPRVKIKPNKFGDKKIKTLSGELVRSKSEREIGNFLTKLGIKWEYEKPTDFGTGTFWPDFYLGNDIYLEHWCYNNDSKNEFPAINKEKYLKEREWKEEQYRNAGKFLISSEEENLTKDQFKALAELESKIKEIFQKNFNNNGIFELIEGITPHHKMAMEVLLDEILEIINLAKSKLLSPLDVKKLSKKAKKMKVEDFYKILVPSYEAYDDYLKHKELGFKDFNDLIKDCIYLFKENNKEAEKSLNKYYSGKYDHILVDEFQDVSYGEVELLKLMITKKSNLFAVGDDWQSIYGWRGSDVNYILNFEKSFGNTEKITLPMNYRSTKTIVDASSEFIQKNPRQIKKKIISSPENSSKHTKIMEITCKDDYKAAEYICLKIKKLLSEKDTKKKDILILTRSTRNISLFQKIMRERGYSDINIRTIHWSKGTEFKYVFVIGLKGGIFGFPNVYVDKDIKRIIHDVPLSDKEDEERRIFYVAMTRAKERLFLITEQGNESDFLFDIPDEYKYYYPPKEI